MPGNITAPFEPHPHGLEVAGRNHVDEGAVPLFVVQVFFGDQAPAPVAVERQHVGHAGRFDSGEGADALQDLLDDRPAPRPASAIVDLDRDRGDAIGREAEIDVEQAQEAA